MWGAGIAKHFAIPYNRKLWAVPLDEMETSWLGGRVPLPDLEEMIEGALSPVAEADGPERPLRLSAARRLPGADGRLPAASAGRAAAEHPRGARVAARGTRSRSTTARTFRYEHLISTMPLPVLIARDGRRSARRGARRPRRGLRHVSVRCVNIGVGRENLTEKHWIYYPEDTVFHRIFVQGNASPHCNPPGRLRAHLRDHLLGRTSRCRATATT